MFKKDSTFLQLYKDHLYDLAFNNTETRIISTSAFFQVLVNIGFEVTDNLLQILTEKFSILGNSYFDVE